MISETRRATWQRLLAEQQASGLSVVAWCFQQDIREQTFYYWRKRLSKPTVPPATPAPQWLALDTAPAAGHGLMLQIGPVAITVTAGFDQQVLADVVHVLTARC
jgi:hypothetical protein